MFNLEKLIQACNYLIQKKKDLFSFNYTILIKMLYLADKEALKGSMQTITGDKYVSMDNGPVLSILYDLIKNKWRKENEQNLWNSRFNRDGHNIIVLTDRIPHGELSMFEMQILDQIYEKYKEFSLREMINYVHTNCPEWKDPAGSSIPIMPTEILESIGRTPDEIDWILAETETFKEEERVFLSLPNE